MGKLKIDREVLEHLVTLALDFAPLDEKGGVSDDEQSAVDIGQELLNPTPPERVILGRFPYSGGEV